jgi:hypothetical protein
VVLNDAFFDAPPLAPGKRFLNFHAGKCTSSPWPRGSTLNTQLAGGSWEEKKKYGVDTTSVLVIHETGDDETRYTNPHLVHFFIDKQGNVYQLLDLAKVSYHTHNSALARKAIGVEVANGRDNVNVADENSTLCSPCNAKENKDSAMCAPCRADKKSQACMATMRCMPVTPAWYMMPSNEQLDAVVRLTKWLTGTKLASGGHKVSIPSAFPTMEYRAGSGDRYMLLGIDRNDAQWYHIREDWCTKAGQSFVEKRLCAEGGGVVNHGAVNGPGRRMDGGVLTLAAWLGTRHAVPNYAMMPTLICAFLRPPTFPTSRDLSPAFDTGGRYKLSDVFMYKLTDTCVGNKPLTSP